MGIIIEIIIELLGEILLSTVAEVIFEFSAHGIIEELGNRKRRPFYIEATGYVIVGGMIGAASLFIFPESFISSEILKSANLLVTPVIAGAAMTGIGALRRRRGQETIRLDSFAYGALFAFSIEIVRYFGTS